MKYSSSKKLNYYYLIKAQENWSKLVSIVAQNLLKIINIEILAVISMMIFKCAFDSCKLEVF